MKTIDLNSGEFMANGKKYLIQFNKLSIERYSMYEKLGLELGFGVGYKGIFDAFLEVFNALTKGNNLLEAHHKASTIAFNQMTAIQKQGDSRVPSQVMFCTLFCNTEDEELATWDEDLALRKINDWKVEGLNVISFFHLASNFLIGFTDHLKVEALEKIMLEIPTLTALTDSVLNKENTGKKGWTDQAEESRKRWIKTFMYVTEITKWSLSEIRALHYMEFFLLLDECTDRTKREAAAMKKK